VILAGGSGTRLWPASRRARPKQLLPLAPGGESLLGAAVRRARVVPGVADAGGAARVVIVTAAAQVAATRAAVPGVHLITEPMGRNTAAAIGLAAAQLAATDPGAVLAILPADQHIADEPALAAALARGLAVVEARDGIGTIGIAPTRAEPGFGYLEVARAELGEVADVLRFAEKPDRATAERYVASGRFLWNAGMFLASARRILAELATHAPAIAAGVAEIVAGRASAADIYAQLPAISFDHAVMERAAQVFTIPAAIGWDDVGSWSALPAVRGADAAGNTIAGPAVVLRGGGNVVVSDDDTLIAVVGLDDVVVVKSGNAVLVIRRDAAQEVRDVVDELTRAGLTDYL
jgi:mannose-1-phosphate guanylyltransferase